ncbi:hypothetical protein GLOIN_2v808915 [Rhizophagus irregularis DAOM 181602=DAOM 197198]|nr:hypothetical protein GLOIN_2v808915 [Rhizophagus irregularis DAOM 181602=DAOM 197198]
MEGNSNQNGSSSFVNSSIEFRLPLLENISNNCILLELEQDGFITPDEKAEKLIKNLTKLNYLFALKLLFDTPFNQFSDEVLRNSLVALADPTHFDYYGKQSMVRLELHIRTWVAVLEKICVTPMRLSKELRDKVYSSLAKFAEIHKKTTQVMQEGIDNNFRSEFNQFNQLHDNKEDEGIMNKRNYNIDFLLIHLRDTLHSLRDDETWFQEIIRRTKELLKAGHILPSIEVEDLTNNQYDDSDSDDSEVDLMLTKKKKILKAIRLNPNISLKSIFQIRKKQHPTYLNAIKELKEKNYKNAEHWCKEFLKTYPESYSIRCILAYTYRCLNNYKQAHLHLNEAIELKGKKLNAWYIRGEIHLRQGNYDDAVRDLITSITSINYNAKMNFLYIMIGISYCNSNDNEDALKYFDNVLQNDPNNHLCLRYCAYIYEKQGKFSDTLKMLDKLLKINEKDSLILCYYGETISKMKKYDSAITYFTKASNIDPENIHNLTKRAIIYCILQEYEKALLDINNIIQLDTCKGLIYFIMADNIELDPNIDWNLKFLNLISKINEFANINHDESLLLMRCTIYIRLKKYEDAVLDLDRLFEINEDISFAYLLQKYSDFWLYLCKSYLLNDRVHLGITNYFDLYMYRVKGIYFMSHLMKFNCKYQIQFRESYLNGRILSLKGIYLSLPEFSIADMPSVKNAFYDIIWKINIKKIISSDCFIKFIVERKCSFINKSKKEYVLQYEDILELEGLGWISYVTFCPIYLHGYDQIQLSIVTQEDSIDMQIEYARLTYSHHEERIYFPKTDYLLPFYAKNIPETFKDKYFLRKETENLLELNDIIDNL